MRSPSDPNLTLRRRIRLTWLIGAVGVAACAWWALIPSDTPTLSNVATTADARSPELAQPAAPTLDVNAFSARIWNVPAAPAPRSAKAPAAQSLPLELIGIINDGGQFTAALYDPKTGRVLVVKSGDRIKQHTVTTITADLVELSDGSRLTLSEDRSG